MGLIGATSQEAVSVAAQTRRFEVERGQLDEGVRQGVDALCSAGSVLPFPLACS
mgnify:CR=1 FL=1|jgi:hypothetical protein